MDNLHQPSKLITPKEIVKIEKAFQVAWSRETTHPDTQAVWSADNPALGQCAVTAIVIYDLFGGQIIVDKINNHLWNIFPDGSHQDFSRCQFQTETTFSISKYKTKAELLTSDYGVKTNIKPRYDLLKKRFQQELNQLTRL